MSLIVLCVVAALVVAIRVRKPYWLITYVFKDIAGGVQSGRAEARGHTPEEASDFLKGRFYDQGLIITQVDVFYRRDYKQHKNLFHWQAS